MGNNNFDTPTFAHGMGGFDHKAPKRHPSNCVYYGENKKCSCTDSVYYLLECHSASQCEKYIDYAPTRKRGKSHKISKDNIQLTKEAKKIGLNYYDVDLRSKKETVLKKQNGNIRKIRKGDQCIHIRMGKGEIIEVSDDMIKISFGSKGIVPYLIKEVENGTIKIIK